MPSYEPRVNVGARVTLYDGRIGEIVEVRPDRPAESAHDEDLDIQVRLDDDGDTVQVAPGDIQELVPPTGAEDVTGA